MNNVYPIADIPIEDDKSKAQQFEDYYTSDTQQNWRYLPEVQIEVERLKNLITYKTEELEYHELIEAIKTLKNSAPGGDSIMNIFLKQTTDSMRRDLLNLYNTSWITGTVPDEWKQGVICPILKPNKDATLVESYRPITLLPTIGKLMEKIVLRRLEYRIELNKLLADTQMGFRRGRSTVDALQLITGEISKALTNKTFCIVVYLDIKGAFDAIWHEGLLFKLKKIGERDQVLKWIQSYLKSRKVKVRIGNKTSEGKDLICGLPQGGALSPMLFNIMLGDMPSTPAGIYLVSYADDITVIARGSCLLQTKRLLQRYLNELGEWFRCWRFTLCPDKTYYRFLPKKDTCPIFL